MRQKPISARTQPLRTDGNQTPARFQKKAAAAENVQVAVDRVVASHAETRPKRDPSSALKKAGAYFANAEQAAAPTLEVKGLSPGPDGVLLFGGSFSPPTIEHMGLLARIMERYGFTRAVVDPTTPYKKNAAPGAVSLSLCKTAVESFHEILDLNSIAYDNFQVLGEGRVKWTGKEGKTFELVASGFEIDRGISADSLRTLREIGPHLEELFGKPIPRKDLFWVSGADSFASVPSWTGGDDRWKEVFQLANFLVIGRPDLPAVAGGDHKPKNLDFKSSSPLAEAFPRAFCAQFEQVTLDGGAAHIYTPKTKRGSAQKIFLLNHPTLDVSSTRARAALAEDASEAQLILQPSVFQACLAHSHFSSARTRANLELYLRSLFGRAHRDAATAQEFEHLADELIHMIQAIGDENVHQPDLRVAMATTMNGVVTHPQLTALWTSATQTLRSIGEKIGIHAAAVHLAQELVDQVVTPALRYYFGGTRAAPLAMSAGRDQVALPGGDTGTSAQLAEMSRSDPKLDPLISEYRRRLLRGDPSLRIAKAQLGSVLHVDDAKLAIHVVDHPPPQSSALPFRRREDGPPKWYDLELSLQELQAILGDPHLAQNLAKAAAGDAELEAHYVLAAIQRNEPARLRLDFLAGERYFRRLSLGDVPDELLASQTAKERDFVLRMRQIAPALLDDLLGPRHKEALQDVVGDCYVIARLVQERPERREDPAFWRAALDAMITRSAGGRLSLSQRSNQRLLADRLPIVAEVLASFDPDLFGGALISYGDRPLLRIGGRHEGTTFEDAALEVEARQRNASSEAHLAQARLLSSAKELVARNREIFNLPPTARSGGLAVLSPFPVDDPDRLLNLEWDLTLFRADFARKRSTLATGYEHGLKFLATQAPHPRARALFERGVTELRTQAKLLDQALLANEAEWLRARFAGPRDQSDQEVPGFVPVMARYQQLRSQVERLLAAFRELNQMLIGLKGVDLGDAAALAARIREATALPALPKIGGDPAGEWRAAIDIGSWNARLLVVDGQGRTLLDVARKTHLGPGTAEVTQLEPERMDRALKVVEELAGQAQGLGIDASRIEAIATSRVRNSANGEDFMDRVRSGLGLSRARIVPQEEEAALEYRSAVAPQGNDSGPQLVLGVRGGSFQLAAGDGIELQTAASTEVGAYAVRDLLPSHRAITAEALKSADEEVAKRAPLPDLDRRTGDRPLTVCGYDATFLRMHTGHRELHLQELLTLREELSSLGLEERMRAVAAGKTQGRLEALSLSEAKDLRSYAEILPAVLTLMIHVVRSLGRDRFFLSATDSRAALIGQRTADGIPI